MIELHRVVKLNQPGGMDQSDDSGSKNSARTLRQVLAAGGVAIVVLAGGGAVAHAQPPNTPTTSAPQPSENSSAPSSRPPSSTSASIPLAPDTAPPVVPTVDPSPVPGGKWKPTENPNATIVPGQMRSDRRRDTRRVHQRGRRPRRDDGGAVSDGAPDPGVPGLLASPVTRFAVRSRTSTTASAARTASCFGQRPTNSPTPTGTANVPSSR